MLDETGHAVTLSTLVDDQVVVLDLIQGHCIINCGTQPGTVLPLERDLAQIKALKRAAAQISRRLGYGGK